VKLLVISGAVPPVQSGESDKTIRLCRQLVDQGHDVHLATIGAGLVPSDWPVTTHRPGRTWSWRDLPRVIWTLMRCRPDAVLLIYTSWVYNHHPMITILPTIVRRLRPSARFITQFEIADGSRPFVLPAIDRAIWKGALAACGTGAHYAFGTLLRDSHQVVVLCEHHRLALERAHPGVSERAHLIPPPPLMQVVADPTGERRLSHRRDRGVGAGEFLFVHYGYVYPNKGIETLLEAFAAVVRGRPHARLVVAGGALADHGAGTPYLRQLQQLTRERGIADHVTWTGDIPSNTDEGSLWLHAADACVFPFDAGVSLHRSSISAAATHGRAIITTRGAILESPPFLDGDTVLLCRPGDADSLAAAMSQVMNDSKLCERLAAGAQQMAGTWFSWNATVTRTMAALRA
jgi:glycosyltransferase involved in cell wall biosynthesis